MSNLGQGYWELRRVGGTRTRDTGEKEKNPSLLTYCEFQPGFSFQNCCQFAPNNFLRQVSPQPLHLSPTFKHLLE